MAPGLAIDGTARGKIDLSCASPLSFTSSSGLLSPNIMVSAKRNRIIPPEIWNADKGISSEPSICSPASAKKTRITDATSVALSAVLRFSAAFWCRVTAINTGTVPMGSITAKKRTKIAMRSIMDKVLSAKSMSVGALFYKINSSMGRAQIAATYFFKRMHSRPLLLSN